MVQRTMWQSLVGQNNLKAFKYWTLQKEEDAKKFKDEFIRTYNFLAQKNNLPPIQWI